MFKRLLPVMSARAMFARGTPVQRQCLGAQVIHKQQFRHFNADHHANSQYEQTRLLMSELNRKKTVDLIGCPVRGGQPKLGVDTAPAAVRSRGDIEKEITELGWAFNDVGDVRPVQITEQEQIDKFDRVKNPLSVGAFTKNLADKVYESASKGHLPLVIGGDHSIAVGSISGVCKAYPNLGVLWVDAHADINTSASSPSGNLHGMPLSFLMGLTRPVPGFEWIDLDDPPLKLDQLVYVGLRDLEQKEKDFLRNHNIKSFDMHYIDKHGIGDVMEAALKIFGDRPIHISFDIDALDPREAPSTGTPVRGGLTFREGAYLCEYVHNTGKLVSMEVVEINPELGTHADVEVTIKSGVSMIRSALGQTLTHR